MKLVVSLLAAAVLARLALAQHSSIPGGMPAGMSHEEHMKQMNKRGNLAMGFDQAKVTHHFRLTRAGGSIEVSANQGSDELTRKQIREHLRTISEEFTAGVFTSPAATHAEVPPGVPAMRERKAMIGYAYQEIPNGGRVIISTTDLAARKAVHDFLKYQIREHATGDPVAVQK